ncbi:family 10 glycosylhydrolase [Deinococcus radiopugnans]|uniref:family 10 glycosylhydrolase n=1 Tax=Deinococcus radiopugnans TaxID=57497 RepID=UPI00361E04BA
MTPSFSRRAALLTLTLILGTGWGGQGGAQDTTVPAVPVETPPTTPPLPGTPSPGVPLPEVPLPEVPPVETPEPAPDPAPEPPALPLTPAPEPSPVPPAEAPQPQPQLPQLPQPQVPQPQMPSPTPPAQGQTGTEPAVPVQKPVAAKPPVGSGVRGLWVDAFGPGLKTRAQVTQMVDDAARMGVNTLFVQAIRRADCLCLKASVPKATDPDLEKGLDPLGLAVRLAHARGMRVIAWVAVTGIANAAAPNTNPAHISHTHGPTAGAASWMARRPDGSWLEGNDGWLDLGIPEAAEYAIQGSSASSRTMGSTACSWTASAIRTGTSGATIPRCWPATAPRPGAAAPSVSDAVWQDWKRQQVTNAVRRITLEIKSLRPDAWITAATITYGQPPAPGDLAGFRKTRTYGDVLQDWPAWMQSGLIDLNVLMNYKRDAVAEQGQWFDGWNAFARGVQPRPDGLSAGVAAGTAMYLNGAPVTANQAQRSVGAGLGWVGYSYRTPTLDVYGAKETTAQGLDTVQKLLTAPGAVLASPAPWKEKPPTTRGLMGRITGTPVPGFRVVEALQGGQVVAHTMTDGSGYYGFAALPPARPKCGSAASAGSTPCPSAAWCACRT